MRHLLIALTLCFAAALASAATVDLQFRPTPPPNLPEELSINENTPLEESQKQLEAQLEKRPEAAALWHQLGSVHYRRLDVVKAREAWSRAYELDALYAPADVMEATQNVFHLVETGKVEEARAALDDANKTFATSPYFHLIRAEQAMRSRAMDAAENAYRTAISVAPDFFAPKLNLGRFLEFTGRNAEARDFYSAATKDSPDHPMTWDFLGEHQFNGGEIVAALESFRKAEVVGKEQPLAEVRLGNLFKSIDDNIGARYWYEIGLARADETARAPILVGLGDAQMRLGLLGEARRTLEEVIESAPSAPVLVARGYVAEEAGEIEEAASFYRDAVKIDPGNVVASNNLAMALVRLDDNPEEALAHSRYALERQPNNAAIAGTYAVTLAHAGENEAALSALRRNVRISPSDPWIRYFLGRLLHNLGEKQNAKIHLHAVEILDPDFDRLEEVRKLTAR